jgi:hypothetical protein
MSCSSGVVKNKFQIFPLYINENVPQECKGTMFRFSGGSELTEKTQEVWKVLHKDQKLHPDTSGQGWVMLPYNTGQEVLLDVLGTLAEQKFVYLPYGVRSTFPQKFLEKIEKIATKATSMLETPCQNMEALHSALETHVKAKHVEVTKTLANAIVPDLEKSIALSLIVKHICANIGDLTQAMAIAKSIPDPDIQKKTIASIKQ